MTPQFVDMLCTAIARHRDSITAPILSGLMEDYPHYRYAIGKVQGLDEAIAVIRRTFNNFEGNRA